MGWTLNTSDVWPFHMSITDEDGRKILEIARWAHASRQGTLEDVRMAVGFPHEQRGEVVDGVARQEREARLIAAAPELLEALKGAIGALEFSRDYHSDLGNEDQALCQDRLDAALKAIHKATNGESDV